MNTVFWLGAMVLFIIIEAVTPMLISVWFALGALIAGICSYFGMSETACVLVFAVVSAVSLIVFKKFYSDKFVHKHEKTNADRLIGAKGIVESDIDPIKGKGTAEVMGQLWSAKSNEPIEKGSMIEVEAIEGVKLVVKKV